MYQADSQEGNKKYNVYNWLDIDQDMSKQSNLLVDFLNTWRDSIDKDSWFSFKVYKKTCYLCLKID